MNYEKIYLCLMSKHKFEYTTVEKAVHLSQMEIKTVKTPSKII